MGFLKSMLSSYFLPKDFLLYSDVIEGILGHNISYLGVFI